MLSRSDSGRSREGVVKGRGEGVRVRDTGSKDRQISLFAAGSLCVVIDNAMA